MKNNYPWNVGDLALYFEDRITTRNPENGKNAVIVGFHDRAPGVRHADILVDGKILTVSLKDLQIPPVKKVRTNFGIK